METKEVLALGPGIAPPWRLIGQRLDTGTRPNEPHLEVAAERGARFACPDRGYRSTSFTTMIYLIAVPLGDVFKSS